MKMSNEGGFIFSVAVIVAVCVFVMALLLVLIIGGYDRATPVPDVNRASIVAGGIALMAALLWFMVKALVGHLTAHYAVKKMNEMKRKNQELDDEDIDTSDIPEVSEKFFKNARLTQPGESLLDSSKDKDNG